MYSKADIELIRQKIDLVKFLEEKGVTFRVSGSALLALCPLHNERSPSFNVRPASNTFICYGCGKSGDIITLVQELDSLSFVGAIQYLADYGSVEVGNVEVDENYRKTKRLYDVLSQASDYMRENFLKLEDQHPAKKNLAERNLLYPANEAGYGGLTDPMVGWSGKGQLTQHLQQNGFSVEELIAAGLLTRVPDGDSSRLKEVFINRLCWTIHDTQKRPIGFSGRKVFEDALGPKYLNTPQTELYNKSRALLGLSWAKPIIIKEQQVIIAEGQTDVMAFRAVGIDNVVASCGTAFAEGHIQILNRLSASGRQSQRFQLIFCFDGDNAGTMAAKKVFEKNPDIRLNAYVAKLGEYDPCDLRAKVGDDALKTAVENRIPLLEFILEEELKTHNISIPEGRRAFLEACQNILVNVTDPIQREGYVRKIASWTGITLLEASKRFAMKSNTNYHQSEPSDASQLTQANLIRLVIAASIQHPTEYAEATQNQLTPPHLLFGDKAPLFETLQNGKADLDNQDHISLLHQKLGLDNSRLVESIQTLVSKLKRQRLLEETANLNARIAADSSLGFEELYEEQLKLKELYK